MRSLELHATRMEQNVPLTLATHATLACVTVQDCVTTHDTHDSWAMKIEA
jgi:hypothetical protein